MKRILLIRTGALGDFILTLPVLTNIRRAYPKAYIQVLGNPAILALAGDQADKILDINEPDWARFFAHGASLPQSRVQELNSTDLVLSYLPDADGLFRSNLLRAGAERVISFTPHPPVDGSVHITDHLLTPLSDLGIEILETIPKVRLTIEDRQAAEQILECFDQATLVMIHPGSGGQWKCWAPDRFAEVADHVYDMTGRQILLLGGPADINRVTQVSEKMQSTPSCIPQLPLKHLAAIQERAMVYLGNDSGPTHLAAATGAPTVALFGPTDPAIWSPRGPNVRILEGDLKSPPSKRLVALRQSEVLDVMDSLIKSL